MYPIVLAIILIFGLVLPANAVEIALQTFVTMTTTGGAIPCESIFFETPLNQYFGIYGLSMGVGSWSEGCAGIVCTPFDWCRIFGGAGVEQAESLWRLHSALMIENEQVSFLADVEVGGEGFDFRSEGVWRPAAWLGLGYTMRRREGIGPRVEISLPCTSGQGIHPAKYLLWGTPYIIEPEKGVLFPGAIVGLTAKL